MADETHTGNEVATKQMALLEQYAAATKTKVVISPADLDVKDRVMGEMLAWCKEQKNIAVLRSAAILASDPTSRTVQNCKSLLLSKGVHPGQVYAATNDIIKLLLQSGENESPIKKRKIEGGATFSDQQKHLRDLVMEAVNQKVSDIHIQVRQMFTRIRMRQHGELRVFAEWSERLGREIASVAFNKETDHATSHFNPLVPQDASMPLKIQGKRYSVATGECSCARRLLIWSCVFLRQAKKVPAKLDQLGYTEKQIALIMMAMKLPFGAIIVAGPTGSGKTTTLASCMEMVESTR